MSNIILKNYSQKIQIWKKPYRSYTDTAQFGTLAHKRFKSICTEGRLLSSKANIEPNYKLSQDEPSWAFAMILDLSGQFFKHFLFHQRIKELKKLRQQLAYSSFACKSSWIMLSSLDLYFTLTSKILDMIKNFWKVEIALTRFHCIF